MRSVVYFFSFVVQELHVVLDLERLSHNSYYKKCFLSTVPPNKNNF